MGRREPFFLGGCEERIKGGGGPLIQGGGEYGAAAMTVHRTTLLKDRRPPPQYIRMDSVRICPLNPPDRHRRDRLTSTWAFASFSIIHFTISFTPPPPEGFFYSSPAPAPEQSLTCPADKQESANAPFLSGSL